MTGTARAELADWEWCDGSGPKSGDTPCGAWHHDHSPRDIADHTCEDCGDYTPGARTCDGGLCDECDDVVADGCAS